MRASPTPSVDAQPSPSRHFPDCHRLCGPGCLRDSRAVAPSAAGHGPHSSAKGRMIGRPGRASRRVWTSQRWWRVGEPKSTRRLSFRWGKWSLSGRFVAFFAESCGWAGAGRIVPSWNARQMPVLSTLQTTAACPTQRRTSEPVEFNRSSSIRVLSRENRHR